MRNLAPERAGLSAEAPAVGGPTPPGERSESCPREWQVAEGPSLPATATLTVARQRLFLALVAVLPLHTFYLSAWISWKPYLVLLAAVVVLDLVAGWRAREWPWDRAASLALAGLVGAVLLGWPAPEVVGRYLRLVLAVIAGGCLLLVTERGLRVGGQAERVIRLVPRVGAAMAATAVVFALVALGTFGEGALTWINDLPGVHQVAKPVYLVHGFIALTNWHHEAGYGASWMTLWAVLTLVASFSGAGWRIRWMDAAVIGGLGFGVFMSFSRTAWAAFPIALLVTVLLLTRAKIAKVGALAGRLGAAALIAILLAGLAWLADRPGVGGDLSLQLGFRMSQTSDLASDTAEWLSTDLIAPEAFGPSELRALMWHKYLRAVPRHPWTGCGLGVMWERAQAEPHNLLVELLTEAGILGLLSLVVVLGVVVARGSGVVGWAALITAFLPMMTLTVFFEATWWFAAGLLLGGGSRRQHRAAGAIEGRGPARTSLREDEG